MPEEAVFGHRQLQPQHQRAIDRLTERFAGDDRFLALLVGGSIAKGWERPDSDVDVMLIATDEEYSRRRADGALQYFTTDVCDYQGGYVDGKVVDAAFLHDVAERGVEPARAAFQGAFATFSRLPDLQETLRAIGRYSEARREENIRTYYSQVQLLNWYVPEAEKRGDRYLLNWSTTSLALYAGRLFLAYNRVFFPYHKWFTRQVAELPEKPEGLLSLMEDLLANPDSTRAQALTDCANGYREWGISFSQAVQDFMQDAEWFWRDGRVPPADR